eukprot:TRINITY_DN3446_c0_g1_i1.p1 TRINITY_DN3446_c0_g1~~TRINITY_DN3446_c0_g1_i1.p1  ORF type:complete len:836 (+),score=260.83 TRINITY_DN3446_c0_g1_i1:145-2508(+)
MPKNPVRVCVRTRPTDRFAQDQLFINTSGGSIDVDLHRKDRSSDIVSNVQDRFSFKFDRILHNTPQETVYNEIASDVVKSVLEGYNGTIMCYGQTGAGKTFTMTGGLTNYKYRGIIPRAISHIFREVSSRPEQAITVRISYLEIYNEMLYDLLSPAVETTMAFGAPLPPGESESGPGGLLIMEDGKNTFVRGLTSEVVPSEEDALALMFEGEANRTIGEHQMNVNSSRSHCIFTIHLEMRSRVESGGKTVRCKLNLVDLAGSERASKTMSVGTVLKEASYINKSLSFLEQVVIALSTPGREHIPYRQTKLTNVLKDSLGGNCKTSLIANIWAEPTFLDETISTLKFATRMMRVQNEAVINVQMDPATKIRVMEKEIRELRQELAMINQLHGRSHVRYEPISEERKSEYATMIREYLGTEDYDSGKILEVPLESFMQVRDIFVEFKKVVKNLEVVIEEKLRRKYVMKERPDAEIEGLSSEDSGTTGARKGGAHGEDLDDEGAVGDLEGEVMGAGVAAPAASFKRGAATKDAKRGKKRIPASPGGDRSSTDDATLKEDSAFQGSSSRRASFASDSQYLPVKSKQEAFEEFKSEEEQGRNLMAEIREAREQSREKKLQVKEMASNVNSFKRSIDSLRMKLDEKRSDRGGEGSSGETEIIDEEEFVLMNELKDARRGYREAYDILRETKKELEYMESAVIASKEKLVPAFEEWYSSRYREESALEGGETEDEGIQLDANGDVLDEGEKFERMEMDRILEEDPESGAFYKARKERLGRSLAARRKLAASMKR